MSGQAWPPPPDEGSRWYVEHVREAKGLPEEPVALRAVALWGREVLVDEAARVFCDGCRCMVDVGALSPWGRGPHRLTAPPTGEPTAGTGPRPSVHAMRRARAVGRRGPGGPPPLLADDEPLRRFV
jgi:hypothetical protein